MSTNTDLKSLIDRLEQTRSLSREEWIRLIRGRTPELAEYLFQRRELSAPVTTDVIFISGG